MTDKLPRNIYRTTNPKTGEHNGFRVLMQSDGKIISKSFNFRRFEDPLKSAIEFRNTLTQVNKRVGCTTGMVGVTKTSFVRSERRYFAYVVTWRPFVGEEQRSKNFTYASGDKNGIRYDADLELLAFRTAIHFRHVAMWYKAHGLSEEFLKLIESKKIRHWYSHRPEWIFT